MPITPRALRVQAIVLPLVIFIVVLALNQWALWQKKGPQDASFWLFVFLASTAIVATALVFRAMDIGVSVWKTFAITVASAAISFYLVGPFVPKMFGERTITVGNRGPGRGGGFTHGVGATFRKAELDSVFASANRLNAAHAFNQFTCGDEPPEFRFEMTLRPQGEDNERLVSFGYTPEVDNVKDRCLDAGMSYLIDSVFFPIDTGPRVKYGYVNPRTGERLPDEEITPPRKPVCRCDLRHSGGEWVAYSQKAADELGPPKR